EPEEVVRLVRCGTSAKRTPQDPPSASAKADFNGTMQNEPEILFWQNEPKINLIWRNEPEAGKTNRMSQSATADVERRSRMSAKRTPPEAPRRRGGRGAVLADSIIPQAP